MKREIIGELYGITEKEAIDNLHAEINSDIKCKDARESLLIDYAGSGMLFTSKYKLTYISRLLNGVEENINITPNEKLVLIWYLYCSEYSELNIKNTGIVYSLNTGSNLFFDNSSQISCEIGISVSEAKEAEDSLVKKGYVIKVKQNMPNSESAVIYLADIVWGTIL